MDISIGSYKFRLEILLLISVVFWIMYGHILCGCSNIGVLEGFEMAKQIVHKELNKNNPSKKNKPKSIKTELTKEQEQTKEQNKEQTKGKEGFAGLSNFGLAQNFGYIMDPSKWSYSSDTTPYESDLFSNKLMPTSDLDVFVNTAFKPECCPSIYTSSTGCACLDTNTENLLSTRGGNNVPHSRF